MKLDNQGVQSQKYKVEDVDMDYSDATEAGH